MMMTHAQSQLPSSPEDLQLYRRANSPLVRDKDLLVCTSNVCGYTHNSERVWKKKKGAHSYHANSTSSCLAEFLAYVQCHKYLLIARSPV